MLMQIIDATPKWVFVVFFVLLWYGWMQSRTRDANKARVLLLPSIMVLLSIGGVFSSFGGHLPNLAAWLFGFVVAGVLNYIAGAPAGVTYNPATARFHLPGSWVPLGLMMGIYVAKYVVGATTALDPAMAQTTMFAVIMSIVFGSVSGLFFSRFLRIWAAKANAVMTTRASQGSGDGLESAT